MGHESDLQLEYGWLARGIYIVTVEARRVGNVDFDASLVQGYILGETCGGPKLTVSPGVHEPTNTVFVASASATCTGGALPEYRFSYRLVGDKTCTTLHDFDLSPTVSWDTTGFAPGSYQLQLEVRANDFAGIRRPGRRRP